MKKLFQFILAIFVFLHRLTNGRLGGQVQGLEVLVLTRSDAKRANSVQRLSDTL
jgi:hypothetical protein